MGALGTCVRVASLLLNSALKNGISGGLGEGLGELIIEELTDDELKLPVELENRLTSALGLTRGIKILRLLV